MSILVRLFLISFFLLPWGLVNGTVLADTLYKLFANRPSLSNSVPMPPIFLRCCSPRLISFENIPQPTTTGSITHPLPLFSHSYLTPSYQHLTAKIIKKARSYLRVLLAHSTYRSSLCKGFNVVRAVPNGVLITVKGLLCIMHELTEGS